LGEPQREKLQVNSQRAVLVGLVDPREQRGREKALDEMRGLVKTAGAEIVGSMIQMRDKPDVGTYIGSGKLDELRALIEETGANLIAFDNSLSPSQAKAIEEATKTQVVDRSEVILDIFATHARSHESRLQVELAQLLYMRSRLTRMWTHLERIAGGIVGGRGPGEKQLETDRRLIDKRITDLKKKLSEVEKRREREVAGRKEKMTVSLVGYTNAGKSTLMNALTGAEVYVADQLFATLDTRTRAWTIPHWGELLLSDTVGFIRNLPHHLVASFRSTLEEARHADLLLHVVDASHPEAQLQITTVQEVLGELGVDDHHPLLVLNKIDAVEDRSFLDVLQARYPEAISVSAHQRSGLDELAQAVASRLSDGYVNARVEASAGNGRLLRYLQQHSEMLKTEYLEDQVAYECRLPRRFVWAVEQEGGRIIPLDGPSPTEGPVDIVESHEAS
jgi:GTP-binding protein HflX